MEKKTYIIARSKLPKQGYWYKHYSSLCVLCGRESGYKVRVYDRPKPEDWQERHELTEEVCNNCRYEQAF